MRTAVTDLGYGEGAAVVAELLERIDAADRPACAIGGGTVVHPTTWGRRRVGALLRSVGASDGVPRAVAIARSHADATVTRCAVVETCLLPDTGGHWSVHLLRRHAGEWTIDTVLVDLPADAARSWAALIETADVAVVDGRDEDQIDAALRTLPSPAGGTVRADRRLIADHGGPRRAVRTALDAVVPPPPAPAPRTRRRVVAAVLAAMAAAGAAGLAVRGQPATAAAVRTADVAGVSVDVPGHWQRTDLDEQRSDGAGSRAVFADPADGGRLVIVVSSLRAGSTWTSVADSLRNRLAQRGDDVVREFAADASFAGRRVISYRETPASGPPIAWYLHVASDVQVSIGCQRGTGDASIDDACAGAVASLHIAQR